jgi:lipopolysaccharide transport system ATP-binding protein
MSETVIQVDKLSKRYVLAHETGQGGFRYKRFSDVLVDLATAPFRAFKDKRTTNAAREEFWALRDVSFEINRGEVIGVIGRNGAGKSTLLKILSRITEPTSGRIEIEGRVASLLEVGTGFHPELTGRENIYLNGAILGMSRREIKGKFDEIVAFAEVDKFLDTPVRFYSSGMYVRLAFAVAAHLEPEILIVDEVLAVGDAQFQKKCLGKMQDVSNKEGRTIIFVSHNMAAVSNLCHRGIVLQNGQCVCDLPIVEAVEFYNRTISTNEDSKRPGSAHVLFEPLEGSDRAGTRITKIEVLDEEKRAKPIASTWDDLVFRMWYQADRKIPRAGAEIQISSVNGARVFVLSTQPHSGVDMDLLPGLHFVDCRIRQLPLAAGDYLISAGLSIPKVEWLWYKTDIAVFTVQPKDVYNVGDPPNANRALVAPDHIWTLGGT